MAKRTILTVVVAGAVIAGLAYFKVRQIQTAVQAAAYQPPPEAVTTIVARREAWPATLNVVGTLAPVHGVTVSADLPGTVDRILFDSGMAVHEGDILVELDTRQERAQLAAAEAQRDLAKINFGRTQELAKQGVVSQMEYDRATADQRQTEANVGEIRAAIERKTIRAPFSGVLGLRQVNLGQYLSAGSPIVSLQSLNPIYVNFGVPQQLAARVHIGRQIRITSDEMPGMHFAGEVNAIDSVVDEATRNIQVQATLSNPAGKLRAGMFVQVEVAVGASQSVIPLPASAVNYAPYGDSVFVVAGTQLATGQTQLTARQQFVKVEGSRGDQVAITSGIKPGDEVVTSGVFKLRNGAAVAVNNKVLPANNPAPKPEDN